MIVQAQTPYVVNIDSPNFRKLVVALPSLDVTPSQEKQLLELQAKASERLSYLFKFTGLFEVMSADAFKSKERKVLDVGFWKTIGVDSVSSGSLTLVNKRLTLTLWTQDVHQNKVLLKQTYKLSDPLKLETHLRNYVDKVLNLYTGRPGIFQTKIAFIGKKTKTSHKQVYLCDFDGSNVRQITAEPAIHLSPSWNPSGTELLYTSYQKGNPDLYLTKLASKETILISGTQGINIGGTFTPQGKLVAFTGSTDGDSDIYVTKPSGGPRRPLLVGHGSEVDASFSPDGRWLAYVSGRFFNPHIFVAELTWNSDFSDLKVKSDMRLTHAGWYNATPTWSPDSKKIVFAGFDKDIGRFDLFMMNPDGSKLERLTLDSGDNESPTFSPNGRLMMFQSNRIGNSPQKGVSQLYIMNHDGSEQRRIDTGLYLAEEPNWGPFIEQGD